MREPVVLQITNLDKKFPGVHALKDVTFSIQRGQIHGLVGENGAGKSTLIKSITGAYTYDSGEILFIVYASKGDAYKGLDVKNTVIGENGEYVYVWTQSVEENENITDENAKNEYKEIAKYFETIKDSVKIVCVQ